MKTKTKVKVESGVAITPIKRGRPSGPSKYPWDTMKKGESFVAPTQALSGVGNGWAKRNGKTLRFAERKMPDGSFRVWRVK